MKVSAQQVGTLIWVLIYGGLFAVAVGIALERGGASYGAGVVACGAIAVAAGIVLIWVRSRLREP